MIANSCTCLYSTSAAHSTAKVPKHVLREQGVTHDPLDLQGAGFSVKRQVFWSLSDLGRRQAKIGPSEDSFCRICRPIAPLWVKTKFQ